MANDATTESLTIPTGTDVVKLYADLQNQLAQIKLQATGLALTHDENMAQIGQQANATAAQLQAAMANVAAQQQANAQRYDIDLKNYGLSVAQLNFQQRTQQLTSQLQTISEGVDVVRQRTETGMANYQQRQGALNSKLQIADMLASRKGPQDFYAYNNLLNTLGGQAPGNGSTTVDPFQWVNGLVQPISDQLPSWAASVNPNPNTINQPYTAQSGNAGAGGGGGTTGGGGSVVTSPAAPGSAAGSAAMNYLTSVLTPSPAAAPAPAAAAGPVGYDINKVNKGWNLITLGPGGDVARSDFDPSISKVYGSDAFDPATGAPRAGAAEVTTAKAGSPVWVYHAAGGGLFAPHATRRNEGVRMQNPQRKPQVNPVNSYMRAAKGGKFDANSSKSAKGSKTIGPVVVGDGTNGAPTGNEEIASVQTSDPNAKLNIQPANGQGLDMQANGDPGTKAEGALAAIQQGLQALTDAVAQLTGKPGGDTGAPPSLLDAGNPMMMPPEMGAMPHAAGGMTLAGRDPAAGAVSPDLLNQPRAVAPDRYMQTPDVATSMPSSNTATTGYGATLARQVYVQQAMHGRTQASQYPQMPGGPAQLPGSSIPTPTQAGGFDVNAIRGAWQNALRQWMMSRYPHLAAGGTVGQATNAGGGPAPFDYYGTGTTTPTLSYNSYTPEQLGSMPFIQKLFGNMAAPSFQGTGSPIANSSIGIQPGAINGSLLNLQKYQQLYPTEQELSQSLLTQGLGLDFNDILRKSQAAAPVGASFATAGYRR